MSDVLVIDEKCGCGAEFHYSGRLVGPNAAKQAASEWRAEHRHIEPPRVGICGDANRIEGPNPMNALCDLPAGHSGWHQEGERATWGYRTWITP